MEMLTRVRQYIASTIWSRRHARRRGRLRRIGLGGARCTFCTSSSGGELALVGLAHFNHQLRERRRTTNGSRPPCRVAGRAAVCRTRGRGRARPRASGARSKTPARTARHVFFDRARAHFSADRSRSATRATIRPKPFLLRLLRGAGPRGLAAMYPRNGHIIRPLLECRRDELRAWLGERASRLSRTRRTPTSAIPAQPRPRRAASAARRRGSTRRLSTCSPTRPISPREMWEWMTAAEVACQGS